MYAKFDEKQFFAKCCLIKTDFIMKKWIFWLLLLAAVVCFLVFFFKDTLPFILGGVAALILRWAYNRWIAKE